MDASVRPRTGSAILTQISVKYTIPLSGRRQDGNDTEEVYVQAVPTIVTNDMHYQIRDPALLARITMLYLPNQVDQDDRFILIEKNDDFGWSGPLAAELGYIFGWILGLNNRREVINDYILKTEKYLLGDLEFYQQFFPETKSLKKWVEDCVVPT